MFNIYLKVLRVIGDLFENLSVDDTSVIFNRWITASIDRMLEAEDGEIDKEMHLCLKRDGGNFYTEIIEIDDDFCEKVISFVTRKTRRGHFDAKLTNISVKTSPVDDVILIFTINGTWEISFEIF